MSTRSAKDSRRARPKVARTGGRSARVVAKVLAATLEVFAAQGYGGFSVEAVAIRAGVNKTTIYRRWPAKADLVGAALFALRDEDPAPPDTGSLREDLVQILRHWAAQMETPRRRAITQSLVLANTDPDMQALVRRLRRERPAIPELVFERALKRRELPEGSDTQLIAVTLLGPLHSRTYWKREHADELFIRALVNLVITGASAGGAQRLKPRPPLSHAGSDPTRARTQDRIPIAGRARPARRGGLAGASSRDRG